MGSFNNKFHAVRCVSDEGEVFDSKKELGYYYELRNLMKATNPEHRVVLIERQIKYDMIVNSFNCGFYKLDFRVTYANGNVKYVDIKGIRTGCSYQLFRLKKKIVQALYNIRIDEL